MTDKRDSNDEIRRLIPLRVTDDLTADEASLVDEEVRYSAKSRADLETYQGLFEMLRETGSEKLPVEDRPSLWTKIEPKLGPAVRYRKQSRIQRLIPTWQLAAACLALFALTIVIEVKQDPATVQMPNPNIMVADAGRPTQAVTKPPMVRANIRPLGTVVQDISPDVRQRLPIPGSDGVLIVGVLPGSPAHDDGIRFGDILLRVNGQPVSNVSELLHFLRGAKSGEEIQVELFRNGAHIFETLRLGIPEAKGPTNGLQSHPSKMREFHEEAFQVATPHLAGFLPAHQIESA